MLKPFELVDRVIERMQWSQRTLRELLSNWVITGKSMSDALAVKFYEAKMVLLRTASNEAKSHSGTKEYIQVKRDDYRRLEKKFYAAWGMYKNLRPDATII